MNLLENEQIAKLSDQYQQLSGRDKLLTQFLIVFVLICIGYFFIYQPSVTTKNEANQLLAQTEKTYKDIQKIVPQIMQAKINAANASQTNRSNSNNANKSMTAMVNESSKKFAITISKSTADGNDGISISGNEAVFDQLIRFMGDLMSAYGLTIETYNIKESTTPGKVDYSIKVTR